MRALKRNARKKARRLARFRAEFRDRRGPCGCPNCILVAGVEAAMGSLEDLQIKITHDQVEVKPNRERLSEFLAAIEMGVMAPLESLAPAAAPIKAPERELEIYDGEFVVLGRSDLSIMEQMAMRYSESYGKKPQDRATEDAEVIK